MAQLAVRLVTEPIFEADFLSHRHGFRPKRSAHGALEQVRVAGDEGRNWVVDADISAYFDNIDQDKLLALVAGLFEDGTERATLERTPQGGVISPLLANICIRPLHARIDRVRDGAGVPRVKELELLEPSLFLVQHAPALDRLADAQARLRG